MCDNLRTLHQNEIGYIGICEECDNLHIQIGNFLSCISKSSFRLMLSDFNNKKRFRDRQSVNTPTGPKILVRLTDNSYMSHTLEEFESVVELFEYSNHLLSAMELLEA
jgi:hypothetical protein